MSQFFNLVKRIAALYLRLSQLQGKLKFGIRRGNRAITLNAIFEIEALERKIEALQVVDGVTTVVQFTHFVNYKTFKNGHFEYYSIKSFWFGESKKYRETLIRYGSIIRYLTRSEKAVDVTALCCDLPVVEPQNVQTPQSITNVAVRPQKIPVQKVTAPDYSKDADEIAQKFADGWEKWSQTDHGSFVTYNRPYCLTVKQVNWLYSVWIKQYEWGVNRDKASERRMFDNLGRTEKALFSWQVAIHKNGSGTFKVLVFKNNEQQMQAPKQVVESPLSIQKTPTKETFTVHCGQLIKTSQPPTSIHQPRYNLTMHNGQLIPTVDAYYQSLQLPDIERGDSTGEEYWKAVDKRREFIMQSIYDKLENDPTHYLLVFAPVILRLHKFLQALYWTDEDRQDYHIRSAISEEATTTYYGSYPQTRRYDSSNNAAHPLGIILTYWNSHSQCQQGVSLNGESFFFCRNKSTGKWELWHYLDRNQ